MIVKYEKGDEVIHDVHKQKARIMWVHPTKDKYAVEHTSLDGYMSIAVPGDISPITNQVFDSEGRVVESAPEVVEMTVEQISKELGKTVKVVKSND